MWYLFAVLCNTVFQSHSSLQLALTAIQCPQAPQGVSDCGTAYSREKHHQHTAYKLPKNRKTS